jgi:hypothetical protein
VSETPQPYRDDPRDSSAYLRRELFHEYQARRVLAARLGDLYLELARAWVHLNGRHTPAAVAACWRAVEMYGLAGMNRQGQVARRWAQAIGRTRGREATQ